MTTPLRIVFDLDGTLVDSAPDILVAANRLLAGEGLAPLDIATITSFIGNGLPRLVERVMAARKIPASQMPRLVDTMRDFYNEAPADLTAPFPGVPALLAALKAQGHKLGVCTNKPEEPTRLILNLLKLEDYFDVVIGGDAMPEKKPHPAPLHAAFAALGEGARIYVGDSEIDAEVALAAEVPFALHTKGYRQKAVEGLPHDWRFDHFDELGPIIDDLAKESAA